MAEMEGVEQVLGAENSVPRQPATPQHPPTAPNPQFTGHPEPESARRNNLRNQQRTQQQRRTQAPARGPTLGGVAVNTTTSKGPQTGSVTNRPPAIRSSAASGCPDNSTECLISKMTANEANSSLATAVNSTLNAAQQALKARGDVIQATAAALDNCWAAFQSPTEARVVSELRKQFTVVLQGTASQRAQPRQQRPGYHTSDTDTSGGNTSSLSATSTRTSYAGVAATPKNSPPEASRVQPQKEATRPPARPPKSPPTPPGPQAQQPKGTDREEKEDIRILITIPPETRLARPSPYAIRKAISEATGVAMAQILRAAETKTGWAITPASKTVRDSLMKQEEKELMRRTLAATDIDTPQRWVNYAVPNVPSAYRTVNGTEIPTTREMIEAEAHTFTGERPVSCRPSRHGAKRHGLMTWIISFDKPVRSFQVLGVSDRSRLIVKRPQIQRHDTGCQDYCNPGKCRRAPLCGYCGKPAEGHDGPANAGCNATVPQCVTCLAPHPSGDPKCTAKPRRVDGHIIRWTKKELVEFRKKGKASYDLVWSRIQQARSAETTSTTMSEDDLQAELEARQGMQTTAHTNPGPTPPTTSQAKRRKATQTPIAARTSTRPQRSTANRRSLNLLEMSANSLLQRRGDYTEPSSSVQGEMTSSNNPSEC